MTTWGGKCLAGLAGLAMAGMTVAAPPDQVFINAKVFTADAARPEATAFAVREGRFLAVGTSAEVLAAAGKEARVTDLGGRRIVPGLVDAHSHAIFAGLAAQAPNLEDAALPRAELARRVDAMAAAAAADAQAPFVVFGVNPAAWSDPAALVRHFDAGAWARRPLLLMGSDYHTGWANGAMRAKAGIDAKRVRRLDRSERHTIGVDADGAPNGVLIDAGLDLVTIHLPRPAAPALLEAARFAVAQNHRHGITAWMDPAANAGPGEALFSRAPGSTGTGILPAYRALAEAGGLGAHVAALLVASPRAGAAELDRLETVRAQFRDVPNLSLPGIKIFADGVLEYPAQSAALLGSYRNSGEHGQMLLEGGPLAALVDAADARGWLVHIHALGDRAVRLSLDAVAAARGKRASGVPHSITHLQLVDPADYPRFANTGAIAVMQLHWAELDNYLIDLVKPYIGDTAFQGQYPARSLQKAGAIIAGASDWPISTNNPWEAMHHGMTRGGPGGGLNAAERLDRETMLLAYTRHAATAIGLGERIGVIASGRQADFVVLDRDVLAVDVESLRATRVLQTWFGGRAVFTSADAPAPVGPTRAETAAGG
ncbi:MAG: amidohydrolase [Xanthomonadales bacterium]|nr:amidohydrolase [Xanthomonadales bacterium]